MINELLCAPVILFIYLYFFLLPVMQEQTRRAGACWKQKVKKKKKIKNNQHFIENEGIYSVYRKQCDSTTIFHFFFSISLHVSLSLSHSHSHHANHSAVQPIVTQTFSESCLPLQTPEFALIFLNFAAGSSIIPVTINRITRDNCNPVSYRTKAGYVICSSN